MTDEHPIGRLPVVIFYTLMVALAGALFLVIRSAGERLQAPAVPLAAPSAISAGQSLNTLFHVLLALAVIILTARAMGALFAYIDQPAVIGEVVGGIMLGPSLLGRIAPGAFAQLLPP